MATRYILTDAPVKRRMKRVARGNGKRVDPVQLVAEMHDRFPTVMAHLAE
ncbi:hypothetical protein [Sphingomonas sp. S2-65]|nr:hypothetical protein [Sphingomonas sp. S2-65]UYY59749.1 hypothetical protein LZ586_06605 [Sphingomonas sp. S2-65]